VSVPRHYVTLAAPARSELEVRRSRFVCEVWPAASEARARDVVEQVRAASRDARHHSTAFVLSPDGATMRSNDDGEPSGTAGAPMLEVLRGRGLTDVVAVVARWFGGTLLGTGGLIRAYGDSVSLALDDASLVRMERRQGLVIEVDHAQGARLDHTLRGLPGVDVTSVDYLPLGVRLRVTATPEVVGDVERVVAVLTSGAGSVTPGPESWAPHHVGGLGPPG
jgi:uncharacterized YigZ family protein